MFSEQGLQIRLVRLEMHEATSLLRRVTAVEHDMDKLTDRLKVLCAKAPTDVMDARAKAKGAGAFGAATALRLLAALEAYTAAAC